MREKDYFGFTVTIYYMPHIKNMLRQHTLKNSRQTKKNWPEKWEPPKSHLLTHYLFNECKYSPFICVTGKISNLLVSFMLNGRYFCLYSLAKYPFTMDHGDSFQKLFRKMFQLMNKIPSVNISKKRWYFFSAKMNVFNVLNDAISWLNLFIFCFFVLSPLWN